MFTTSKRNQFETSQYFGIVFYYLFLSIPISLLGGTGLREQGAFLQQRVPDHMAFPCDVKHQRSRTVPVSVHQLRPGLTHIYTRQLYNANIVQYII